MRIKTGKIIKCSHCGKKRYCKKCELREHNFCDNKCKGSYYSVKYKGKNHSGIMKKGKSFHPSTQFKKGFHYSLKTEFKRGTPKELHPSWRGGITSSNSKIRHSIEYSLWREAVFARDSWTCQECTQQGGVLHAHHIKKFSKYPELRFAIDNGLTLCKKCHKKFHKK